MSLYSGVEASRRHDLSFRLSSTTSLVAFRGGGRPCASIDSLNVSARPGGTLRRKHVHEASQTKVDRWFLVPLASVAPIRGGLKGPRVLTMVHLHFPIPIETCLLAHTSHTKDGAHRKLSPRIQHRPSEGLLATCSPAGRNSHGFFVANGIKV